MAWRHAYAARCASRCGSLSVTALVAQERPLPDQESFLREVRTRLQTDSTLQSSYIYVETRREQKPMARAASTGVGEGVQ